MNSPRTPGPDAARSRLRATVATMEREIARLPGPATDDDGSGQPSGLLASFADLVEQLALGPEPQVRECPACRNIVMLAARRCGHCWTALPAPEPV